MMLLKIATGSFVTVALAALLFALILLFVGPTRGAETLDEQLAYIRQLNADLRTPVPSVIVRPTFQLPAGMMTYRRSTFTQEIAVTNGRDRITPIRRLLLAAKWRQSGGMEGIRGFRSTVYRNSIRPRVWVGDIQVWNGSNFQSNRGWKREYPDGAKFMDVLSTDAGIFEVRQLEKTDGKWRPSTIFRDEAARPRGYNGLSVACMSCHSEAGSGGYATGLVPGGDSILSDPFPSLEGEEQEERPALATVSYKEGYHNAHRTGKPLLIWVGGAPDFAASIDAIHVAESEYNGDSSRRVIVVTFSGETPTGYSLSADRWSAEAVCDMMRPRRQTFAPMYQQRTFQAEACRT